MAQADDPSLLFGTKVFGADSEVSTSIEARSTTSPASSSARIFKGFVREHAPQARAHVEETSAHCLYSRKSAPEAQALGSIDRVSAFILGAHRRESFEDADAAPLLLLVDDSPAPSLSIISMASAVDARSRTWLSRTRSPSSSE